MTRRRKKALLARDRAVPWLLWFVALNAIWLLLISAFVVAEEILGLIASAVGATAAEAVREQGVAGFRPRARWLRRAIVLPWRAVSESVLVFEALARQIVRRRPPRGRFVLVPVALPRNKSEQAAKRALLTVGESFAPNAYVLTIDTRRGLMLMHELARESTP